MLIQFPHYKRNEMLKVYDSFSCKEKEIIEKYLKYRQARGVRTAPRLKDIKRHLVQLRQIAQRNYDDWDLDLVRNLLALLNTSDLSAYAKNDMKVNIKNFLKWKFVDWSKRFVNLDDIKLDSNPRNEKKLNSKTLFKREDIEKMMRHESRVFWKAFFMTQYEGGLRTKEVRYLKWDDLKLSIDGEISELSLYSTKTGKARPVFLKDATRYLTLLKEQQENRGDIGVFVFHSRKDPNRPIDKGTVSSWMRSLSMRALGRHCWCYLLRHTRGTELYRLARQGKISKDTAISFMGHSEDMSSLYTHLDESEIKKMLKEQVYQLDEAPTDNKIALEEKIALLEKRLEEKEHPETVLNAIAKDPNALKHLAIAIMKAGQLDQIGAFNQEETCHKPYKV